METFTGETAEATNECSFASSASTSVTSSYFASCLRYSYSSITICLVKPTINQTVLFCFVFLGQG